ncbi:hypothetical protein Rleg5DRAFT_1878 [Rhizobium leguminosarum bv. viciae WSM1455]|nr:hypothetical protein Rleg5DRAFT_1878 [Rhizobium leguminosarum bv. viciae WSM1455]
MLSIVQVLVGPAASFAFGLIGVVVGALFNAHLNRRRDDRLRDQETRAVAAALYGEILAIRNDLADSCRIIAQANLNEEFGRPGWKLDDNLRDRITFREPKLYETLAGKIGGLSPDLVLKIIDFYTQYSEVQRWFPRLFEDKERRIRYDASTVLDPAWKAVHEVNPALRSIERWLALGAASDPDMGETAEALDLNIQMSAQFAEQRKEWEAAQRGQ